MGIIINKHKQLAEAMNEYFASVRANLDSKLPHANDHENIPFQERCDFFFHLFPVCTAEYGKIITNLKNTNVDIVIISIILVKKIINYMVELLPCIISKCFTLGAFPDQLNIARVTPIFKKGQHSNPSNYRPISSL